MTVSAAALLPSQAAARSVPSVAAVDASSDATGTLDVGQNLTWTHAPGGNPTLATASCGVHQTGVALSIMYGGSAMSTAITNQQSNQYLGLFYISSSDSGARTVTVTLSAAGGRANVQCSATTWTGLKGVDLSSTNESEDLTGFATTLTIRPTSPVPADEIFFGAIHRYVPRGAPALSLAEPGLNGSIVDSNTNEGNGSGFGCQPVSWADWEDCIGTAQLGSGGSSMTFLWATSGYALVAGVGLVEGTKPGTGSGGVDTILGIPTLVFGALILVVAIGVATVVVIMWRARLATRPPSR